MSSSPSLSSSFYLSTIGIMRSGDAAKDDPSLTNSVEKKLRLFGFEVKASVDMVKAAPLGFCAKKEKTSESGTGDQERKYECQFCFKEFANSQALGGHQNAHKKERMKKKRLLLQARKASFSCYLQPFQNQGGFTYHGPTSTPWTFHDSSTCSFVPADFSVCEKSHPGFVPLEQSSCMKGFSFTSPSSLQSQGSFRQTTGDRVPNNYSSSSASNTKHDHMTLDLRLRLSVQSNACKASGTEV